MKVSKEQISELEAILNEAASDLKKVTSKKMFGCHALFANGNVFSLVWKHGQIGVKLTHEADYEKLMKMKGATPWKAGPMKMAHWVLVPKNLESRQALRPWLALAHDQALTMPAKTKTASKIKTTKKKRA
ncbi:MAG: TfoX/Sxy family protein [Bdellovibrionaceae bacterium]|nr:TfoX/Sxy family protein [Pseudobdellovibrionaceae bacterium]